MTVNIGQKESPEFDKKNYEERAKEAEKFNQKEFEEFHQKELKKFRKINVKDHSGLGEMKFNHYEILVVEKINKIQEEVKKICPLLEMETRKLVGQVLAVIAISHLFTEKIVNTFREEVREMCKILEVNVDNMNRVRENVQLKDPEVMALIGRFKKDEEVKAESIANSLFAIKSIIPAVDSLIENVYNSLTPKGKKMVIGNLEGRECEEVKDQELKDLMGKLNEHLKQEEQLHSAVSSVAAS